MDAFRNIGEVSGELGVRKHVLRFWEARFPQLKPMKRGGGRRYYRPADVQLLRGIRHLLQTAGYTIKGVQKILRDWGIEDVKQIGSSQAADRHERGRARPLAPALAVETPRQLSSIEMRALRNVAAELATLHGMLSGAQQTERDDHRAKREAARG